MTSWQVLYVICCYLQFHDKHKLCVIAEDVLHVNGAQVVSEECWDSNLMEDVGCAVSTQMPPGGELDFELLTCYNGILWQTDPWNKNKSIKISTMQLAEPLETK